MEWQDERSEKRPGVTLAYFIFTYGPIPGMMITWVVRLTHGKRNELVRKRRESGECDCGANVNYLIFDCMPRKHEGDLRDFVNGNRYCETVACLVDTFDVDTRFRTLLQSSIVVRINKIKYSVVFEIILHFAH